MKNTLSIPGSIKFPARVGKCMVGVFFMLHPWSNLIFNQGPHFTDERIESPEIH